LERATTGAYQFYQVTTKENVEEIKLVLSGADTRQR
jgi:hypothetical protein